jgi:hypothetical protein
MYISFLVVVTKDRIRGKSDISSFKINIWRGDRVAEGNGLLNRRTSNIVPRVRIPASPLKLSYLIRRDENPGGAKHRLRGFDTPKASREANPGLSVFCV